MTCTTEQNGAEWSASYRFYDEANPWAQPWECRVVQCKTEARAREYAEKEYAKHKGYHDATINGLIRYRETGTADVAEYFNDSHRYWLRKGYNPAAVVYLREDQPGVICSEEFPNPAFESRNGYIHVTVEARKVGEWVADCGAEGPNQYRRYRSALLKATTYEDARRLAEEWIEQIARPFIAHELANQVDRVEVIDADGTAHSGELFSEHGEGTNGVSVKLDNPAAFRGRHRDGIAYVDRSQVRKVELATAN
jgi:hypothetical protein